jgi:tRNA U55 pseudouridine synthase TruB
MGEELPTELAPREVKVDNLELLEWFDEHSFPAPTLPAEASEDLKKLEEEISRKKHVVSENFTDTTTTTVGPACKLRMTVSGGFYVRSLCYDLGIKVDSGAYMAELVRTRHGKFGLEDAVDWEDFVDGGAWEEKVVKSLTMKNPQQSKKDIISILEKGEKLEEEVSDEHENRQRVQRA